MSSSRKKVRVVDVTLHPSAEELVIQYEIARERKDRETKKYKWRTEIKRIPLWEYELDQNLSLVAVRIIEGSPLLASQHIPMVERALKERYIKAQSKRMREIGIAFDSQKRGMNQIARIDDLEMYIEDLYAEDAKSKLNATTNIAHLFRNTEHFEVLLLHDSLLSALSRIIQEEGRRSVTLAANVTFIFAQISNYKELHSVITDHKMGSMAISLLDFTLQKYIQVKQQHDANSLDHIADYNSSRDINADTSDLFMSCLQLLLNLSDDSTLEKKMHQKGIVFILVDLLGLRNQDQVIKLALVFLGRLSIRKETIEQVQQCNLVKLLGHFINKQRSEEDKLALQLTYNLSFDASLRKAMVQQGFISNLSQRLKNQDFCSLTLKILYQLSIEDDHKSTFAYCGTLSIFRDLLAGLEDESNCREGSQDEATEMTKLLIPLLVNLSQNETNSEVMSENSFFQPLIERAMRLKDALTLKVLRNLSQHQNQSILRQFIPFIDSLVALFKDLQTSDDAQVEVVGCLANLDIEGFDYFDLLTNHQLIEYLEAFLSPLDTADDLLLELVIWIGVLCSSSTADLFSRSTLVDDLVGFLETKKEDDEVLLQTVLTLEQLLHQAPTQAALTARTQCVHGLLLAWQNNNSALQTAADRCLDIIMHLSTRLHSLIATRKFEAYNEAWIERAFTVHEQITNLGNCLRRQSSSGLKKTIDQNRSDELDGGPL